MLPHVLSRSLVVMELNAGNDREPCVTHRALPEGTIQLQLRGFRGWTEDRIPAPTVVLQHFGVIRVVGNENQVSPIHIARAQEIVVDQAIDDPLSGQVQRAVLVALRVPDDFVTVKLAAHRPIESVAAGVYNENSHGPEGIFCGPCMPPRSMRKVFGDTLELPGANFFDPALSMCATIDLNSSLRSIIHRAICFGFSDRSPKPSGFLFAETMTRRSTIGNACNSLESSALSFATPGTALAISSLSPRARAFCASVSALPSSPYFLRSCT